MTGIWTSMRTTSWRERAVQLRGDRSVLGDLHLMTPGAQKELRDALVHRLVLDEQDPQRAGPT